MKFIPHLNLFGIEDAKEIPCLTGKGVPSASSGAVGLLYMDVDTGDVYKCVSAANGGIRWKRLEEGSSSEVATPKIGTVTLYADAWQGENNLYSQVVSIDGVTENSQVDITPSAEQIAIFYEKDIAFVTENDGGKVTVFVIGQKPANDYTFQVTITEVGYG